VRTTIDPVSKKAAADTAVAAPVWDLPIRLFHWTLAALIAFSWWTSETDHVDWHIYSGLGILTLLLFRLLWGIFGSSTARFSSFVKGPGTVLRYLRDRSTWRGPGHNPLGALSVIALLSLIFVQVALGLILTDEDGITQGPLANFVSFDVSETAHELHEALFYILLGIIALHVLAIAYYRVVRNKRLIAPMITGKAFLEPGAEPYRAGKWWVALICLAAALALTRWTIAGFPPFGP
jgi:cytochrome b